MFNTPPMCDELIATIGYNAEKDGGRQIFEGDFVLPTGAPKYMIKVIDHLRISQVVKNRGSILTTISTEEHS